MNVRAYTACTPLQQYITGLVKHAENVLRSIYGCRGRLRPENLDARTAERIEEFLKKQYGKEQDGGEAVRRRAEVQLDFDSINALRIQSDAVREALEVRETPEEQPEEVLTAQTEETTENVEAEHAPEGGSCFDSGRLSAPMRELIGSLSGMHCRALREILIADNAAMLLSRIAEEEMTLPEIIIDEINEAAASVIDDILIDALSDAPRVLEQYEAELRDAVINGG